MFADVDMIGMRRPAAMCLNMVIRGASEGECGGSAGAH